MAKRLSSFNARRQEEMERRRVLVAAQRLGGMTQREIAASLGVDQKTVSNDLKAIRAEWLAQRVNTHGELVSTINRRYDVLLNAHWNRANSDVAEARLVLEIERDRRKLLGIDEPSRTELSGPEGGPIAVRDAPSYSDLPDEAQALLRAAIVATVNNEPADASDA